jgi:hypothetical protein
MTATKSKRAKIVISRFGNENLTTISPLVERYSLPTNKKLFPNPVPFP